jgi:predicted amino acid racemase
MGRYYSGDINGKFWFAVQSSDSADRFGVYGREPNYIEYYFTVDDLETLQEELKSIEEDLGENLRKVKAFFNEKTSYTDKELSDYLKINEEKTKHVLREYADYELGKKIEKSILENGECLFQAEL